MGYERLVRARSPVQALSGGTGTPFGGQTAVRRVLTTGQYVGLSGSSVSADGRYLTFTDWSTGDLAVRDLVTGENRRITNNSPISEREGFAEVFMRLSGDGKQLAYMWHRDPGGYELRVINVDGSGSRRVTRSEQGQVAAYDWSADGKHIAAVLYGASATGADQIALIEATDGSVRALIDLNGPRPGKMSFSPDGRFLAYDLPVNGEPGKRSILVLPLDGSQATPAVADPASDRLLGWAPGGGALLFTRDRAGSTGAWLQLIKDGKPQGAAQQVKDKIGEGIRPLGFTRDGAYYYATPDTGQRVYTASLDLEKGTVTDSPASVPQILGSNEAPEWSPDGKSLAYIHNGSRIVIRSLETGTERALTPKTMQRIFTAGWGDRYLRWSPDGLQLLAPQREALFVINVGTGEATQLGSEERSRYGRWSSDGKSVFYAHVGKGTRLTQIVKRNLETQQEKVLYNSPPPPDLPRGHDNFHSLELSPDDQWLAFAGSENTSGLDSVLMVLPAEGGLPKLLLQVPSSEWMKVVGWTPDARGILFTRDRKLASELSTTLWVVRIDGGEPHKVELGMNVLNDIRFHPDGRHVVFDSGQRGEQIFAMENFLPLARASQ